MAECLKSINLLLDEELINGRLDNGLTYYIKKNMFPKDESFLGLIVNVGSVMEEDYENGVAHFIEHVSLREYESKNQEIYMSGYTNFTHTCYSIRCISSESHNIEDALLKLKGIAQDVSFNTESIYTERKIINQEINSVNNRFDSKLRNIVLKDILNNSRYSQRIPINKYSSIDHINKKELIDFYNKWYVINNMAIIAVGDFNSKKIDEMIKKKFSFIKNNREIEIPRYFISDFEKVKILYNSYKEIENLEMVFYFKKNSQAVENIDGFKNDVIENLFLILMMNFIKIYGSSHADYYKKQFSKNDSFISINVKLNPGYIMNQVNDILKAMVMIKDGITKKEVDYIKEIFFQDIKSSYEQRDNLNSKIFFSECIRNFVMDEPIISIKNEFILVDRVIRDISKEEIIDYGVQFLNNKNLAIIFNLNDKAQFNSKELATLINSCELIKTLTP